MFKHAVNKSDDGKTLRNLVQRDVKTAIVEKRFRKTADEVFTHKEYHPIVNQRVFSLQDDEDKDGYGGMKEILNIQFKETYSKFLYLSIH
jgi:hypothetical protein